MRTCTGREVAGAARGEHVRGRRERRELAQCPFGGWHEQPVTALLLIQCRFGRDPLRRIGLTADEARILRWCDGDVEMRVVTARLEIEA